MRVQDPNTGIQYAAKICIADDYDGVRTEQSEAFLAAKLRSAGTLFAPPVSIGRVRKWAGMPDETPEYVCFVSSWIEGLTLEDLSKKAGEITPRLIIEVAEKIIYAINFLQKSGLKHDDLHWGNVMVQPRNSNLIVLDSDEMEQDIVIVDLGSLKHYEQPTAKSRDDYLSMVSILTDLYNVAWRERSVHATHPMFLTQLKRIIAQLVDDDPSRYFVSTAGMLKTIQNLEDTLLGSSAELFSHPFTPFEAISAEHLADDRMLLNLFQKGLPWFNDVLAAKPIVLTGPRGCGKSMLFRYMAVTTQMNSLRLPDEAGMPAGFGVYISCSTLLQNHLLWVAREEGRPKRYSLQISTYFQLTVLRELVVSVARALVDERYGQFFSLHQRALDSWIETIDELFGKTIKTPKGAWEPSLLHYASDVDRMRIAVMRSMLDATEPPCRLADSFLGEVTQKLAFACPAFSKQPVVFLLDDYTDSRISPLIQEILNPIVFERRSSHYFKVSCERSSLNYSVMAESSIDPGREFTLIDAGASALRSTSVAGSEMFLKSLLDQRLTLAGWSGRCDTLIGSSDELKRDTSLAEVIRGTGSKTGKQYYYFGMQHLARMWSGDISTILQVVNAMCQRAGVCESTTSTITRANQHEAIVDVSRQLAASVRDYHPYGPELDRILQAYGKMARHILVEGSLTRADNHPRRLYQIEMTTMLPGDVLDQLHDESAGAAALAKQLLRRSVFHPLIDSRGKEAVDSKTFRWEMRPMFRPGFGLSLVKDGYIDVKSIQELVQFLMEPQQFADIKRLTYKANPSADLFSGGADDRAN